MDYKNTMIHQDCYLQEWESEAKLIDASFGQFDASLV